MDDSSQGNYLYDTILEGINKFLQKEGKKDRCLKAVLDQTVKIYTYTVK